jgi:hypothetical protein
MVTEGELFDKRRCVKHVATLQQCMVTAACSHGPELDTLTACCDLLPGGNGYNSACTDPAAVLSSFLQSSAGMRADMSSFLPVGVDLNSLMQLSQYAAIPGMVGR